MHLPTIRQLQYLVELRKTLHFGRAAAALHVTQSTLSTGIKELEQTLGVNLVERTNKRVSFTPLGDQFVDKSRYTLMQCEDLVEFAQHLRDPLAMPVRLGVIPTIAPYLAAPFVRAIRETHPGLQVQIMENTTAACVEALLAGTLDLVLLALPFEASQLATHIVAREGFRLVHARGGQFEEDMAEVARHDADLDRLPDESLLLLNDGHCLRDHVLAGCRLRNQTRIHTLGCNSLELLIQMVELDLGVTFVPDMAVASGLLRERNLGTMPLPADRFYRDIGFAWRKGASREPLFRELTRLLRPGQT